MKSIKYLISISILFLTFSITYSQTADDIIDKYVAAIGGLDKISSIKTVKLTGKSMAMGMDIPFIMTIKKPDKILLEVTMQGMTMKQAYDGTTGWQIMPFGGNKDPEKMNEEETKQMKEQAQFEGKLVNYKDKGSTVELLGKEDMEGTEVYKLKLTEKDSTVTVNYLDANSYLLLKETGKRKIREKEISMETIFGDYKSEDGYLLFHSMETKTDVGQMGSQKITIEKAEFNIPVEDDIFKMPESK
jgi:hypothetical protein